MKLKNITALVLASMLLASCGSEPADTTTDSNHTTETAPATAAETVDPNDRSQIKDNLPDSLDFGGQCEAFGFGVGLDGSHLMEHLQTAVHKHLLPGVDAVHAHLLVQRYSDRSIHELPWFGYSASGSLMGFHVV